MDDYSAGRCQSTMCPALFEATGPIPNSTSHVKTSDIAYPKYMLHVSLDNVLLGL